MIQEIILDEQTSILCGYDECKINDGVVPNKVLDAGIIPSKSDEHETISYVVLNTVDEKRWQYELNVTEEIIKMGEQSLSPDMFDKLEEAIKWIRTTRKINKE